MKHIVMYSGGICSWATAKRLKEHYHANDILLLFCDTTCEDEDLYRFLGESSAQLGLELIIISDGRSIWQVFKDVRFMGNSRIDPCSRILKRELADAWVTEHYGPDKCIVYVGMDWTESHRVERMQPRKLPYKYEAPMCDAPYLSKEQMIASCIKTGIRVPRLYDMGFMHNNCGGFCIKSGQAQFKQLYVHKPEYYMECERLEQEVFLEIGAERPFIRITRDKKMRYISLRDFRIEYIEGSKCNQIDLFDFGGCGCFADSEKAIESYA